MTLPTDYQQFIATGRYARWLEEKGRRETYPETVSRYFDFMETHLQKKHSYTMSSAERRELEQAVINLEIMPSMRCLTTAGPALERDNICGYNCAYAPVDSPRIFDETLYILMCGTGVGFSVERQFIANLPEVPSDLREVDTRIVVEDSKTGWAESLRSLIDSLYRGGIPTWDLSKLRPAGSRLKTFGGRSSGPGPLASLFEFTVATFKKATGRKLTSIECHDLMCKIGEVVVVGGVRRAALISLSNLTDERMRLAKSGQWWEEHKHRALANNSVCYTEKPDIEIFMAEFLALIRSKSGERGIFNRSGVKKFLEDNVSRRDPSFAFGTNPCSEIILRPNQFCNLSEVILRPEESWGDTLRKARLATILGTFQATLTDFKYIRECWKVTTEEERLLGVSLTGIMDNAYFNNSHNNEKALGTGLRELRDLTKKINAAYAEKLGIAPATAITCVKPSGTVSQLVDSASGIHPRYSKYYIRTVRGDIKDPLTSFLIDRGVPFEPDVMNPGSIAVFSFPMKAPENSVFRNDRTALEQLELWKIYQMHWCEHKPSITVYVRDNEWLEVADWVYKNFELCSGVSFLPHTEHTYQQAPYQEISEDTYQELIQKFPSEIDWEGLRSYEKEDTTTGSQEFACTGGACEIL